MTDTTDLEKIILGECIVSEEAAVYASENLAEESFTSKGRKEVFNAIRKIAFKSVPVDLVSISQEMQKLGYPLMQVGQTLAELESMVTSVSQHKSHVGQLKKKAKLGSSRKIIKKLSLEIDEENFEDKIDQAVNDLYRISGSTREGNKLEHISNISPYVLKRAMNPKKFLGILSGYPRFDKIITGFKPGNLIVIAARPAIGKSAMAACIAKKISSRKVPVAIFNLEMTANETITNILAGESRVENRHIEKGYLTDSEKSGMIAHVDRISEYPLYINDYGGLSVAQLWIQAKMAVKQLGVKIIFIDYLQLLRGAKGKDRREKVDYCSRSLKLIAKELNIPVVALAQLNRGAEGSEPQLNDLRESGSIENDADMVIFLHRDRDIKDDEVETAWIVKKHRGGPTGAMPVMFHKKYQTYYETEEEF